MFFSLLKTIILYFADQDIKIIFNSIFRVDVALKILKS